MPRNSSYYKRYIPDISLSLEKGTKDVPNDGKYYLLKDGTIIGKFTLLNKANEKFKEILVISGYKPKHILDTKINPGEESIDRYIISKSIFWAEGPKYKDKRGRGGRGGV